MENMPPMGPPAELKQLEFLVGNWECAMKAKMDPTKDEWTESKGACTYSWVLGGAALQMSYKSDFMGMPFEGLSLETYNRETEKWQTTWVDNMSCSAMLMEGTREGGKCTMEGDYVFMGTPTKARVSTANETPNSFDWKYEESTDGGKTWATSMTAVYTKQK